MKTKFKIGGVVIAVLLSVYTQIRNESKQSEIQFLNMEALANGESGGLVQCLYTGSVDCSVTHVKVYKMIY